VTDAVLVLPSAGPDPIPLQTAVDAVLGYAHGRRPLLFRSPSSPDGRWVEIPAFGYDRFDRRPRADGPLGEADILIAECLHGRLEPAAWSAMKAVLDDVAPLADAATDRAAGRPFWELPDDEFSVLSEPGTVGAVLRQIGEVAAAADVQKHVAAALHHRRPDLFPLTVRTTRWQLLPHAREGDSGVEAVVHRELQANDAAFAALGREVAEQLDNAALTRLRLHDVLLWLSGSLRLTHAVALGRTTMTTT
jgi:Family of unknown function (DUF6308)